MIQKEALFTQSEMLKYYDEVLVPGFFAKWAEVLLEQVEIMDGATVLDIATGPATVVRAIKQRYGDGVKITGSDISAAMLEIARRHFPQVEFVLSPATALTFQDASFDRVLCQQGFQFFPDRVAAMKEIGRVLRPDGKFVIAVWSAIERVPQFQIYREAMKRAGMFGDGLKVVEAPFSWPDISQIVDLVNSCNLKVDRAEIHTNNAVYTKGEKELINAAMGAPFGPFLASLTEDSFKLFEERVISLSQRYRVGSQYQFPMECNIIIGSK